MKYNKFNAVTDELGRIQHFETVSVDGPIRPSWMQDHVYEEHRVVIDDEEYNLTQNGSLIHPKVHIPPHAILGSGVRIDEGTEFRPWHLAEDKNEGRVLVGDRTRISGATIFDHVTIGRMCIIEADFLFSYNVIGDSCVFAPGSRISGASGLIGDNVKVGEDANLSARVQIDDDVSIGASANIALGVRIGKGAIIDKPGDGYDPRHGDFGPFLSQGVRIAPGAKVHTETRR